MESKTLVMVVMLGIGAAGVVGAMLSIFKPPTVRETEAVTAPSAVASFPTRNRRAAADESAEKLAAPDDWQPRPRAGKGQANGSLSFIRGGQGMETGAAGGPGGTSEEAAAAAARGDAKAVMAGLKQDEEGQPGLGKKAVRALMQKVVDTVHDAQPRWYNEFLANRELKAIADTYDKTQDFGSFLRQLSKSPAFTGMLKKRKGTSQMRALTKKLMSDKATGPQLEELFFAHAKDPDVIGSIRQFGPGSGLPAELMEYVGAPSKKSKAKPVSNRPKLQLNQRGFGGGFGSSKQESATGGTPEGVDPAMLQQYQKYLKK